MTDPIRLWAAKAAPEILRALPGATAATWIAEVPDGHAPLFSTFLRDRRIIATIQRIDGAYIYLGAHNEAVW
jgi:hypothetical protein